MEYWSFIRLDVSSFVYQIKASDLLFVSRESCCGLIWIERKWLHLFEVDNSEKIIEETDFHFVVRGCRCSHWRTCIHLNQPGFQCLIKHYIKPINLKAIPTIGNHIRHTMHRLNHDILYIHETLRSYFLSISKNFLKILKTSKLCK